MPYDIFAIQIWYNIRSFIREAYIICVADIIASAISPVPYWNGYHCKSLFYLLVKEAFTWPARRDLNPRPLESESTAISSFATGGYDIIYITKSPLLQGKFYLYHTLLIFVWCYIKLILKPQNKIWTVGKTAVYTSILHRHSLTEQLLWKG